MTLSLDCACWVSLPLSVCSQRGLRGVHRLAGFLRHVEPLFYGPFVSGNSPGFLRQRRHIIQLQRHEDL